MRSWSNLVVVLEQNDSSPSSSFPFVILLLTIAGVGHGSLVDLHRALLDAHDSLVVVFGQLLHLVPPYQFLRSVPPFRLVSRKPVEEDTCKKGGTEDKICTCCLIVYSHYYGVSWSVTVGLL